jgi:hypothetical protein
MERHKSYNATVWMLVDCNDEEQKSLCEENETLNKSLQASLKLVLDLDYLFQNALSKHTVAKFGQRTTRMAEVQLLDLLSL